MNRRECSGEVVESHVGRPSADRGRQKDEITARSREPRVPGLMVGRPAGTSGTPPFERAPPRRPGRTEHPMRRVAPGRQGLPAIAAGSRSSRRSLAGELGGRGPILPQRGPPRRARGRRGTDGQHGPHPARRPGRLRGGQAAGHRPHPLRPRAPVTVGCARVCWRWPAGSRGCAVIVHAHGGNIETWLTHPARQTPDAAGLEPPAIASSRLVRGRARRWRGAGPGQVRLIDNGVDCSRYVHPSRRTTHRACSTSVSSPRARVSST